ncbi:hypothetical protein Ahy_A05g022357 [Arachis hypogaea]|uniref:Transposase MuDR plant domain-containing protein n=1 Tax=Arachis hypogaea TaxID=3818 RepID=A0A445D0S4_ARAHY|nr:hypothetical protein Ahy_A05g022357 [Arachis hypogaea]
MNREYEFQVVLEFKSLSQFKEAVKEHALLNGRDIRFRKNDKVRCRVVCKERKGKCKWVCFASKVGGSDCFRIKTLNGKHTCGRIYSGRLASSSWISKKIANNITYGGGTVLRDLILSIAKATYVKEWKRRMNQLKEINRDCYNKLFALDPKLWTKSHFTFLAKSDMLINNILKEES